MGAGCVVIWAGRGNYEDASQAEADIAATVAAVKQKTSCYLIMSVLNDASPYEWQGTPNYQAIMALNSALSATYLPGNHYLDIRSALVGLYNPNNPADLLDFGHDVLPYSLRAEDIEGTLSSSLSFSSSCAFSTRAVLSTGDVISVNAVGESAAGR